MVILNMVLLEELIIDSGLDFIEDALDYEDKIHNVRLIRWIKNNIEKFENREEIEKLLNSKGWYHHHTNGSH